MNQLYSIGNDKYITLLSSGANIYMNNISASNQNKSSLLCNDFQSQLTTTIFNACIYFAYINTNNELIIRNTMNSSIIRVTSLLDETSTCSPTITSFSNMLALIYDYYNPIDSSYIVKCSFPLDDDEILVTAKTNSALSFQVLPCENCLYVYANDSSSNGIVKIDNKKTIKRLLSNDECDYLASNQYNKILAQKNALIESIKTQYNDLYKVANTYKSELEKLQNR